MWGRRNRFRASRAQRAYHAVGADVKIKKRKQHNNVQLAHVSSSKATRASKCAGWRIGLSSATTLRCGEMGRQDQGARWDGAENACWNEVLETARLGPLKFATFSLSTFKLILYPLHRFSSQPEINHL